MRPIRPGPAHHGGGVAGGFFIGMLGLLLGGYTLYHDITGQYWALPQRVIQIAIIFVSLVLLATHAKLSYHMWTKNTFFNR